MSLPTPRRWALALAGWSAFVWVNRLNNLRGDDAASDTERILSTAMSVVSLAMAAGVVAFAVAARRRRRSNVGAAERGLLLAFAGWTVAVWAVRAVDIVVSWRSVGFVAVHVVLAAVSVVLAAQVWRAVRPPRLPRLPLEPVSERSGDR